jgi:hypothetical protein
VIQVGDVVRVTRKAVTNENGWDDYWCTFMDLCIGKQYEVIEDLGSHGFVLKGSSMLGGEFDYCFPGFVLEKIE